MSRVYQVVGTWPDGSRRMRRYLSRRSAEYRRALFLAERPPPSTVDILVSDTITWPENGIGTNGRSGVDL